MSNSDFQILQSAAEDDSIVMGVEIKKEREAR